MHIAVRLHVIIMHNLEERWMKFKLRNENIVVSLTTTPYRINHLNDTLKSLYAQNAPIQRIYISIPYVFKRDQVNYNIPQWLQDESRVTILRTEDYGPATKILGALEKANLPPNTIIISVDDDVDYPYNLVLQLAYKAQQNNGRAIGLSGINIDYGADGDIAADSEDGLINIIRSDAYTSALQGVAGIAYRRYFFDNDIFDIVNAPRECINSDDLYISFYLARHNILRQVLYNKHISVGNVYPTDLGRKPDALRHQLQTELERHRICMRHLRQLDPQVKF